MTYKGDYGSNASYSKGDVVVYEDGVVYVAIDAAAAGITPHEERCWERLAQPMQEMVVMFHDMFNSIAESIPTNIDDDSISLKTETAEYLITVDDSGDTPELVVEAIEEEADAT